MDAPDRVNAGQAVYTPLTLKVYDSVVLGFSNRFLWRCPTSELEAMYDRNVSDDHLDIGVGTGYFLDRAKWPTNDPKITLVDLNDYSLRAAANRIARYAPTTVVANVFEPLPNDVKFRSIGINYLLHCLPGRMAEKAPIVFDTLLSVAAEGASFFGATILQGDAPRSPAAQSLMNFYNRKGIFSNDGDTLQDLEHALIGRFQDVQIKQLGSCCRVRGTQRLTEPSRWISAGKTQ